MWRGLVLLACCLLVPAVRAAAPGQEFMALSLHDVVDDARQLDGEAVTTQRLVNLFDWLAGNGYSAVSLDDLERAGRGERPLPPRAILLSVDDGYASLYTRVYPLALAYRMPVVAALVTSWLDVPPDGAVPYGDATLPRSRFITWDQAREMQASGWIEFASHSNALHRAIRGNPQGNLLPATVTPEYVPGRGYEAPQATRARVRADLQRSRERMAAELGRAPRAIAWPYGRYGADATAAAKSLGFRFGLTLGPGPASAARPMEIARLLPTGNPELVHVVAALRLRDPWPAARRLVCVDPAAFAAPDPEETNERLGLAIERLRRLGATHVVIDALARDGQGRAVASWFPTTQLPVRADLLARLSAQMRGRAGVRVVLRLPHADARAALGDAGRVLRLYEDLATHVPLDALLVEDAPALGQEPAAATPWDVAAARREAAVSAWPAADALAWRAFRVVEGLRPEIELFWLAPADWPLHRVAALAEVALVPAPAAMQPPQPPLRPPAARRVGVWWHLPQGDGRALAQQTRRLQAAGVTGFGWCPDAALADVPPAAEVAPAWSASTFPAAGAR